MNAIDLNIDKSDAHKLLSAANGDTALLYLYLKSGNALAGAEEALRLSDSRIQCAAALLRQLGLWTEEKPAVFLAGERPQYSETDVIRAMDTDGEFRSLYGEVQRQLGRTMNTEELKILLGFTRYLGLPADVISVLVCYCKDRARQRGNLRNPSLRTIEKEAYAWAERGIDTMEEAAAYIQAQNIRQSRVGKLMRLLQIHGRKLMPTEDQYVQQWLDMGFDEEALSMAYEKTCLNTGGLKWSYMHKILLNWQEAGTLTGQQVKESDRKPVPKGASGQLGAAELEAIKKVLQEG